MDTRPELSAFTYSDTDTQTQTQAVLLACEKYVSKGTMLSQLDTEKIRDLLAKKDEVALSLHKVVEQEKAFVAGVKALTNLIDMDEKSKSFRPRAASSTRLRRGLSGTLAINVPIEPALSPVGKEDNSRKKRVKEQRRKSVPDAYMAASATTSPGS
eukprot:gb/GEZN01009336.1/.p1 GENE.gb/GEZN01009336.1/~~gb/GEZN01009336.1/.p1  ORF type:complete len:156 (+),score=30.94 gb/GEZN01009336.1/:142-609(+)